MDFIDLETADNPQKKLEFSVVLKFKHNYHILCLTLVNQ